MTGGIVMKQNNPFTLIFGVKPSMSIERTNQFNIVKDAFLSAKPYTPTFLITGVRGSGKTVFLTTINQYFAQLDDWIVVELNPETNMVESLAAKIYQSSNMKFKFAKKEFSFSFHGVSFSIEGEKPISDASSLLLEMLLYLEKKNKKILISIDEISNTSQMKMFAHEFQILIRADLPVYLVMTGLYENVRNLQDENTLTFLYRLPTIQIESLDLIDITDSFEKVLNIKREFAIELAKLTNGYAYAYQVLGFICYENDYKQLNDELLKEYDKYLRTYVYEKIWNDLPKKEREIVIAISNLKERTTKKIMEEVNMNKFNFSQYRNRLVKKGIVYSPDWGELDFVLPRFSKYVLDIIAYQ